MSSLALAYRPFGSIVMNELGFRKTKVLHGGGRYENLAA